MSNVDQLKKLKEGLVLLSRDREVVFSFHETFKHVDELLEIVDDLLATGGTAKATGNLVAKLKGEIVSYAFLIILADLKGRILLEPNKSGEIIWKFSTDVALEAACNVPGHYEAGMISKINSL